MKELYMQPPGNAFPPRTTGQTGTMVVIFFIAVLFQSCGMESFMVTSFDRSFPDKWIHSPSDAAPHLSNCDTVYAGVPWALHVFFRKYSRDKSGNADVSFSYKIIKPNGELFHDTAGIIAFSGMLQADAGLLLSRGIPVTTFSRNEIPGRYTLIVTAEDNVAGTKRRLEKTVVLAKCSQIEPCDFNDISFNVWVHSYCIAPDPGRAVMAFSYFIKSELSNDDEIFWPVFYFFQCLFADNPALVEELVAGFPHYSARLREYTVFLLRAIRFQNDSSSPIPDSLWSRFDKVTETGYCDPFTVTFKIKSTRLLEFGFYYFGRYDMIRFLIDCLGLNSPAGYAAFLESCNEYGADCAQSLDRETAAQFQSEAKQILEKACSKHRLINAYCNYAYENGDPEINVKQTLGEIIASSMSGK